MLVGISKVLRKKGYEAGSTALGYHNLRHRYSSLLSKKGMPLYEIMERLGHQNL